MKIYVKSVIDYDYLREICDPIQKEIVKEYPKEKEQVL